MKSSPTSADANFLLGEAYLQIKKGSKAVPYLNEAAKLGKVEAHLRLATFVVYLRLAWGLAVVGVV